MIKKGTFTGHEEALQLIDGEAVGNSMREIPRKLRVFIMKHATGICGMGKFMKRWGQWKEDKCPRCGEPKDAAHVWICQGEGATDIWEKAVEELEQWLRNANPTVPHRVILYLKGWCFGSNTAYEALSGFQDAIRNQDQIGWHRFIKGWLAKDWAEIQQRYYQLARSHRTGRRCVMALIRKLWETAWDLWEHQNGILHEHENVITRTMGVQLNQRVARTYRQLSELPLSHNDHRLISLKLHMILKKDATVSINRHG
jgi:hypothetical protein